MNKFKKKVSRESPDFENEITYSQEKRQPTYEMLCELAGVAAWTRASQGLINFIFSVEQVAIHAHVLTKE